VFDTPVRLSVTTSGFDKAVNILNNLRDNIDSAIGEGITYSGFELRDALNARITEPTRMVEVYPISNKEVVIGPSISRIEEIMEVPEWQKYKAARRCIWWGYKTFVEKQEREPLPLTGLTREEIFRTVRVMVPVIEGIMVTYIKKLLRE